jgi:hypothetical protein
LFIPDPDPDFLIFEKIVTCNYLLKTRSLFIPSVNH